MSRIVLSLLVDNTAGVLSRVAGLFSRRGYNIESLTVGVTADPRYSRMTVVSLGDHQVLEQIQKQLGKLEDVHDIKELRFTEFMEQRGPGHTAGDKNFYIKGYGDYKKEIEQAIKELDYFNDPEAYDKEQERQSAPKNRVKTAGSTKQMSRMPGHIIEFPLPCMAV